MDIHRTPRTAPSSASRELALSRCGLTSRSRSQAAFAPRLRSSVAEVMPAACSSRASLGPTLGSCVSSFMWPLLESKRSMSVGKDGDQVAELREVGQLVLGDLGA